MNKEQVSMTKAVAIIFMLLLHLFCTHDYRDLFTPKFFIGDTPVIYYIALFGDNCVAIFLFCSGYGLSVSHSKNSIEFNRLNLSRLIKLYLNLWIVILVFVFALGFILNFQHRYPGNLIEILLNFSGLSLTYNGAWWFFTTYVVLVLSSSLLIRLCNRENSRTCPCLKGS